MEIKFRAWDKQQKAMLHMPLNSNFGISRFFGFLTDNHIVMQYTGLKDKNGKEIYEGDKFKKQVLLCPDGISSAHNIAYWLDVECEVVFFNGSFCGEWKIKNAKKYNAIFSNRQGYAEILSIEVIGNKYENPELLEEQCDK
jgi:uncharacterized phage protein (TIGR01671 family)